MASSKDLVAYKGIYAVLFAGFGILSPYRPVFYENLHMTKSQIGMLQMIPNISCFIFGPMWSYVSDYFNIHNEIMIGGLILSSISTYILYYMRSFSTLYTLNVISNFFISPVTPLLDNWVISSLEDKSTYGDLRLWGAVGFGIFSFLGGYLTSSRSSDLSSFRHLFEMQVTAFIVCGFILLYLIYKQMLSSQVTSPSKSKEVSDEDKHGLSSQSNSNGSIDNSSRDKIIKNNSDSTEGGSIGTQAPVPLTVPQLISYFTGNRPVLIFAVVVFLSGVGDGVIDAFLFLRLKQLGGTGTVMGIARFIMCVSEIPMFQLAGPWQKYSGTWMVLFVAQVAFVIRFIYYSELTNPWWVFPVEALNGITFATLWSVSCKYANEIAPPGSQATMQALLEGLHWGLGSGLGAILGGFYYDSYGAVSLFRSSAFLCFISLALSLYMVICEKNSDGSFIGMNSNRGRDNEGTAGSGNSSSRPSGYDPVAQGDDRDSSLEDVSPLHGDKLDI